MIAHNLEIVALLLATYVVSIPIAYAAAPLFKLTDLFAWKEAHLTWWAAAIWPFVLINAIFLIPMELIYRLRNKAEIFVKNKEEQAISLNPPEPNVLADGYITSMFSVPTIEIRQVCPSCRQMIKMKKESSKSDGVQS